MYYYVGYNERTDNYSEPVFITQNKQKIEEWLNKGSYSHFKRYVELQLDIDNDE